MNISEEEPDLAMQGNVTLLLHGCKGDVHQSIQFAESIILAITLIIMVIISIFGNLVVILAILKNEKLRVPKNSLLASLAFTDMLSPIERLLPTAISSLYDKWVFGCTWCAVSSAAGVFFCSASILHLCAITVERYITINFPHRRSVWISKRNTSILLVVIWALALMMALIPFISSTVELKFNDRLLFCEFYLAEHPQLSLVMSFLYFCLPFILMVIVYYRIYRTISDSARKISAYQECERRSKREIRRKTNVEWNTVKMVMIVIGIFFTLWLPYFSIVCIKSYFPKLLPSWTERLALVSAYLNSCSNFFVYGVMNRNMRFAFRGLLPCFDNSDKIRNISKTALTSKVVSRHDRDMSEGALGMSRKSGIAAISKECFDNTVYEEDHKTSMKLHTVKEEIQVTSEYEMKVIADHSYGYDKHCGEEGTPVDANSVHLED